MKAILGSRKHHYVARVSIFLITAVLVWTMMDCTTVYPIEYKLTVSSTAGGSVVDPAQGISTHTEGMSVYLIAVADEGYRFVSWTGDVDTIGNVKRAQTVIKIGGEYSIRAEFEKLPEYHLTVSNTTGGRVIKPKKAMTTYKGEKVVELEAQEDVGWGFVSWTGDVGTIADVDAASTNITMNGNYSITANFEKEEPVTITDTGLEAAIRTARHITKRPIYPSDLRKLTSLEAEAENVSDLTGLEYCTGLTKLFLSDNQIDDISPVTSFTRLMYLDLSGNQMDDISPVANLTNLTYLDVSGNQMDDISPVANLTNLTYLDVSGNQMEDISPVANLTSLTYLDVSGNQISDISPVANLTSLTYLDVSGNQISDISPVANLTSLRYLDLSGNQISDISAVGSLMSLGEFYLSRNQINDISALVSLTGLRELYLSHNRISDVSALASLTKLTELYLSSNRISDVSALTSLTSLGDLSLADNQVDDISPLANLSNLTLLNLSNNQISDIQSLVDNAGLSQGDKVYLYNNPLRYTLLTYSSGNTHIAELEARGVIVEY
jgi:internalin A